MNTITTFEILGIKDCSNPLELWNDIDSGTYTGHSISRRYMSEHNKVYTLKPSWLGACLRVKHEYIDSDLLHVHRQAIHKKKIFDLPEHRFTHVGTGALYTLVRISMHKARTYADPYVLVKEDKMGYLRTKVDVY